MAYNTDFLENVISVAKEGGDFTSVKDALDSITDNDANNRYTVQIAPSIYTEDNPIQGKEYVSVKAIGDLQTTRIVAANGSADLFTMANFFLLEGLTFWGVTGASNYAINQTVAGLTSLSRCAVAECTNGIHLNHASASMTLTDCGIYNLTATTTRGIYQEAGILNVHICTAARGNITTLIEVTGVNSTADLSHLKSAISTLGTAVKIKDQADVDISITRFDGMTDGITVEGGSHTHFSTVRIENAQNDGVVVQDVGADTVLTVQSTIVKDSNRYDFNLLSTSALVSGDAVTTINKINFVTGASLFGTVLDLQEDDEGFNIMGELHVGLPEQGTESVLGEGDSYTRGMLVYTETAGGVFTDVSTAARSASGSTFTFPDTAADNAIYIASSLSNVDVLDHFGLKTKVDTAAVMDGGEIVLEYWNGSAWVELNGMEVDSGDSYYPHAKNYFQDTGSHHIRYDGTLATDSWTKHDAITPALGTDYYWARIRIETAIDTAPVFEQFKLHTNRFEINNDGWIEYFGKARPVAQLPFAIGADKAFEGNLGNQTIYINQNVGAGLNENNFNSANDKIGRFFFAPYDLDTSSPIQLKLAGRPNLTGTVEFTVLLDKKTQGDVIYTSEPALQPSRRSVVVSKSVTGGNVEIFTFDLDISDVLSRRESGEPDFIGLTIHSSSFTTTTSFAMVAMEATYTKWCEGGHV